jgi:hypothetical protein
MIGAEGGRDDQPGRIGAMDGQNNGRGLGTRRQVLHIGTYDSRLFFQHDPLHLVFNLVAQALY